MQLKSYKYTKMFTCIEKKKVIALPKMFKRIPIIYVLKNQSFN